VNDYTAATKACECNTGEWSKLTRERDSRQIWHFRVHMSIGEKSLFHSLTRKKAKEKRTLV
jgi:hypothetical protein